MSIQRGDVADRNDTPGLAYLIKQRFGNREIADTWDVQDYLYAFGSSQSALIDAVLFVPEFVEIEGAVLLRDLGAKPPGGPSEIADGICEARNQSREALKKFVDSCNWLELPYLFRDGSGTCDEYRCLAILVAGAWQARLQQLFPARKFTVRVLSAEETGNVIGVGIEQEL